MRSAIVIGFAIASAAATAGQQFARTYTRSVVQ